MSGQPPAAPPAASNRAPAAAPQRARGQQPAVQAAGQPSAGPRLSWRVVPANAAAVPANSAAAPATFTVSRGATGPAGRSSQLGPAIQTSRARPRVSAGNLPGSASGPFTSNMARGPSAVRVGSTARFNWTPDRGSDDPLLQTPNRYAELPRQESHKDELRASLARRTAALRRSRNALDVRLVFPRQSGADLELWSNSALLKDASPYFTTLLESDFAETFTTSSSKRRRVDDPTPQTSTSKGKEKETSAAPERVLELRDFDDSDDEADDATASHFPKPTDDDSSALYHEIVLPQACYTTFEAVLSYITTGYVDFAPLSATRSAEKRSASRDKHLADNPLLPLRASPKSVYRLAHLLELPDLAALALANIERQLTVESVARVLFCDVSLCYDAFKDVALVYALTKWSEVQMSKGMQEVQRKVEADEVPEYGKLAFELLMKVGKQQKEQSAQGPAQHSTQERSCVGLSDSSSDEELDAATTAADQAQGRRGYARRSRV